MTDDESNIAAYCHLIMEAWKGTQRILCILPSFACMDTYLSRHQVPYKYTPRQRTFISVQAFGSHPDYRGFPTLFVMPIDFYLPFSRPHVSICSVSMASVFRHLVMY